MKLTCYKDGRELALKDPLDLDYIEYDVINDFLDLIWYLNTYLKSISIIHK